MLAVGVVDVYHRTKPCLLTCIQAVYARRRLLAAADKACYTPAVAAELTRSPPSSISKSGTHASVLRRWRSYSSSLTPRQALTQTVLTSAGFPVLRRQWVAARHIHPGATRAQRLRQIGGFCLKVSTWRFSCRQTALCAKTLHYKITQACSFNPCDFIVSRRCKFDVFDFAHLNLLASVIILYIFHVFQVLYHAIRQIYRLGRALK